jgi:flagellar L-ring protein precursor FlgH
MVKLVTICACVLALTICSAAAKKAVREDMLSEYLARVQASGSPTIVAVSPGTLWRDGGPYTSLAADYKARGVGDLVIIRIAEQTMAEASGGVASQRQFEASSGIAGIAGRVKTGGVNPLFAANSNSQLQGQAQTASKSSLQTSVAGQVVAVLPGGAIVVEARRQLLMNNEKQTVLLRGVARPGDITPDNTIVSTQLANLEIELRGKGVISDATRRPNWAVRALLWLVGF